MSFGWSAAVWTAIGAGITATAAVDSSDKQRRAGNQAKDQARIAAAQQDEATNRANRKTPDSAASLAAAILSGKGGNGGTLLTGPQGVDPNSLMLGKATLLGG